MPRDSRSELREGSEDFSDIFGVWCCQTGVVSYQRESLRISTPF